MSIQYPVSEILRCVDYINDPEKEICESNDEIFVLRDPLEMKEKTKPLVLKEDKPLVLKEDKPLVLKEDKPLVLKEDNLLPETEKIIKDAETTMLQTPEKIKEVKEVKEIEEIESASVEPFQVEEIIKVDNLEDNKKETAEDILLLSEEVNEKESSEYSIKKNNTKNEDSKEIKKLNEQVSILKTHNAMLEHDLSEVFKTIKHKTC